MEKRSYFWSIGAAIYVLGMFPLFYLYQFQGDTTYGLIDFIATFGAFLVMAQAFVTFWPSKKQELKSQAQSDIPSK
ncbi:MAG TPA: hypothetical protein VJN71_07965 [Nitrososphaerales archaeon]|nr:hypothetical protein [Nitrososphaerales archaeon]